MNNSQSLRADEKDGVWTRFVAAHGPGIVVRGTIERVASRGAVVQIVPGVAGFVPLEEIGPLAVNNPQDVLWPGDIVEAIVSSADPSKKRMGLSIKQLVLQRSGEVGSAISLSEREQFEATMDFAEPLGVAACPDVSDWPLGKVLQTTYKRGPLVERVTEGLEAICQETHSVGAAIFRLDPDTEMVTLGATRILGLSCTRDGESGSMKRMH
ncbi:MAG: S1 RNA-binding domain-containing protein [Candidatus Bipolaricaulia bacterium]